MTRQNQLERFSPRPYSERVTTDYKIKCDKHYTLWVYNSDEGLWSRNGEKLIEQQLREWYLNPDVVSNYYVKEKGKGNGIPALERFTD